jgi:hypothetical protein
MTDPAGVIFKTKPDALRSPPKPASTPASEAAVTRTPELEDPSLGALVEVSEQLVSLIDDQRRHFELKVSRLETRLAEIAGGLEVLKANRGVRGPAGPRGEAGARITGWKVNTFAFTATPTMSDGSAGADLDLREIVTILAKRAVAEAARQT